MLSQNRKQSQERQATSFSNQRKIGLNKVWIIATSIVVIIGISSSLIPTASGAPTKFDSNVAPLPLEQTAPFVSQAIAAANEATDRGALNRKRAITHSTASNPYSSSFLPVSTVNDSYGNPIKSLKPIDTPDGRKVVNAQGLQFEIPNYASGITEIKQPADDLLPPFVGELTKLGTIDFEQVKKSNAPLKDLSEEVVKTTGGIEKNRTHEMDISKTTAVKQYKHDDKYKNILHQQSFETQQITPINIMPFTSLNMPLNRLRPLLISSNIDGFSKSKTNFYLSHELSTKSRMSPIGLKTKNYLSNHKTLKTNALLPKNALTQTSQDQTENLDSTRHFQNQLSLTTPFNISTSSSNSKIPRFAIAPLSNGNFNYPNIPTDIATINRIADKYIHSLPASDPIAVAISKDSNENQPSATVAFKNVSSHKQQDKQESVNLISIAQETSLAVNVAAKNLKGVIPDYLLNLNDPEIGGPVDYVPVDDSPILKVIAWDLLPPMETKIEESPMNMASTWDIRPIKENQTDETTSSTQQQPSRQGKDYYISTTPRVTRPGKTSPTTTTPTTSTTTQPFLNESDYFELEAGDSYTLPPWLTGLDDPDLDVALAYVVPDDNEHFYHTLSRDILPPFEPYIDLDNVNVTVPIIENFRTTPQPTLVLSTTKTAKIWHTQASTRRSINHTNLAQTTPRPHWIKAHTTTGQMTTAPTPRNVQLSQQRLSQSITNNSSVHEFIKPSQQNNTSIVATHHSSQSRSSSLSPITTINPKLSLSSTSDAFATTTRRPVEQDRFIATNSNSFNKNLSSDRPNINRPSSQMDTNDGKYNPFLGSRNSEDHSSPPKPFLKPQHLLAPTQTTSTTTTATPEYEESPFDTATIPSWLQDFDYPDVGPGLPYKPEISNRNGTADLLKLSSTVEANAQQLFSNDLLPPTKNNDLTTETTRPVFVANSNIPFGSIPKKIFTQSSTMSPHDTASTRSTIPSKVTNQPFVTFLPSEHDIPQTIIPRKNNDNNRATQPPVVFEPPSSAVDDYTSVPASSSNLFNKNNGVQKVQRFDFNLNDKTETSLSSYNSNFPAPFKTVDVNNGLIGEQSRPASMSEDQELFAPLHIPAVDINTPKTTYGKGDEGKVIIAKKIDHKGTIDLLDTDHQIPQTQAHLNKNNDTGSLKLNPQNPFLRTLLDDRRGGFGTQKVTTTIRKTSEFETPASTNKDRYQGRFGGPPGVLKPFDNADNGNSG